MTSVGLVSLIFGFGYLLQYSFNNLFTDTIKVSFGFFLGFLVIFGGIILYNKKEHLQEYAASIIALGIVFIYFSVYFAGSYYELISSFYALSLLFIVTIL